MANKSSNSDLVAPRSLVEIVKQIDNGDLTASQSIAECLDRVKAVEGDVKAYTCLNENALEQAENSNGPLKGVGLAIKDIIDTANLPTEHNSAIYQDYKPVSDASIVTKSCSEGCIIIGKSVTTEFAFFEPGVTRNPHNLDHTPGGSSSGSAAAIAAGMAHLAIGTQTGGSVIRPAAFCGVTGYKPSAGLFPKVGVKTFSWSLDTVGLFAKGVEDAAFAASCLTGRNLKINPNHDFDQPTIGVVRSHSWPEADPGYKASFEDLLTSLKHFGVDLIDISPSDDYIAAFHAHQVIQDFEARQALAWEYQAHPDKLSPLLRQTLDFASTIKPSDYDEARVCAEIASAEMDEIFEDVDILISLSAPGFAPEGLSSTGSSIFNRIWTLFGLPCINVTGLQAANGLPLGVQLIGPYMADHDVFETGYWLESAIQRHLAR